MIRSLTLLAAAALAALLAVPARAYDKKMGALKPRGACECITKKTCWKLAREAFSRNTMAAQNEIEAAIADRFFPNTAVFALDKPDAEGHFLLVQCGGAPCGDKRELLERRFIVQNFLMALPLGVQRDELFDEKTWEATAKGEAIFTQAKLCKSGLFSELIAIVYQSNNK